MKTNKNIIKLVMLIKNLSIKNIQNVFQLIENKFNKIKKNKILINHQKIHLNNKMFLIKKNVILEKFP